MNSRDLFLKLSNSKYTGLTTHEVMKFSGKMHHFMRTNPFGYKAEKMKGLNDVIYGKGNNYDDLLNEHSIKLLEDPLPEIPFSPPYLYAIGGGCISNRRVAIIGARMCSEYGKKVAYELAFRLATNGFTVVSGLAYGIDYAAHRGALDGNGASIAVLGSGILNCYPNAHKPTYNEIKKNGLIVSEYGFYSKPLKHHFPFRNRLISGLSECLVVVEAKEKSGTMITVNYALEQGKDVYVIPGSVYSELSIGTHKLIQEGADIITSLDDFLLKLENK